MNVITAPLYGLSICGSTTYENIRYKTNQAVASSLLGDRRRESNQGINKKSKHTPTTPIDPLKYQTRTLVGVNSRTLWCNPVVYVNLQADDEGRKSNPDLTEIHYALRVYPTLK